MLLGRDDECARIDRLLDAATMGRGGALVMTGDAGVGKSRLLSYAVEQATDFRVLACSGLESETHLAFSGLFDLLSPVLDELASLPEPQAAAVAGALALGPLPAPRLDRFAVYVGVLSLVAHVAKSRPTLLAVDDVQHLDASSQEALRFLARRLTAEAVAVLIATWPGESRFARAGFPVLFVEGLPDAAGRALLHSVSQGPIAPDIEVRLVTETRGNPLALTEIVGGLRPAQLAGLEPINDPLPVGPRIADAFRPRLSGLRPRSRLALLLLSEAATTDPWLIGLALARAGLSRSDLEPAERVGLIRAGDGTIEFRHPLVRSVVSQDSTDGERRRANLVVAEAFEAAGLADRAVWHRAASVEGPDEQIAAVLDASAFEARARGGRAAAALAFERSAVISGTERGRVRRLVLAAEDQAAIGHHGRAMELLGRASDEATDEEALATIEHRRGRLRVFGGAVHEAIDGLTAAARRIEGQDRALAAEMLTDAGVALLLSRGADAVRETADRALELAQGAPDHVRIAAQMVVARLLASAGHRVGELPIPPGWQRWLQHDDQLLGVRRLGYIGAWFLWYLDPARGAAMLDEAVAGARATGALGSLPFLLACRGDTRLRLGRWLGLEPTSRSVFTWPKRPASPGSRRGPRQRSPGSKRLGVARRSRSRLPRRRSPTPTHSGSSRSGRTRWRHSASSSSASTAFPVPSLASRRRSVGRSTSAGRSHPRSAGRRTSLKRMSVSDVWKMLAAPFSDSLGPLQAGTPGPVVPWPVARRCSSRRPGSRHCSARRSVSTREPWRRSRWDAIA